MWNHGSIKCLATVTILEQEMKNDIFAQPRQLNNIYFAMALIRSWDANSIF
jgi:hypothetical protein